MISALMVASAAAEPARRTAHTGQGCFHGAQLVQHFVGGGHVDPRVVELDRIILARTAASSLPHVKLPLSGWAKLIAAQPACLEGHPHESEGRDDRGRRFGA